VRDFDKVEKKERGFPSVRETTKLFILHKTGTIRGWANERLWKREQAKGRGVALGEGGSQ